ncbi:MAG: hypothetical protein F4Y75_07900 [Acidimicrobiia bacterium]|nr:hypothetical protein [Acidimicrobiia bacterium]MYF26383.1 hypothetical protein [Acidimicrobiia bacterium]
MSHLWVFASRLIRYVTGERDDSRSLHQPTALTLLIAESAPERQGPDDPPHRQSASRADLLIRQKYH